MMTTDGRPIIASGTIERFTQAGHRKVYLDILRFGVIDAIATAMVSVPAYVLGYVKVRRGAFTRENVPFFIAFMVVWFLAYMVNRLCSLRPNGRYLYYDAKALAQAYGLSGFIEGQVKRRRDGEPKMVYKKSPKKLQPVFSDFKVRHDCVPISYAAIGQWIDPYDKSIRYSMCGLDFTQDGVSLRFDSFGSFPRIAKRTTAFQVTSEEVVLKG
ncbi:hypothetical protein [Bifidobacterium sp. ESL0790]|uniref:hypothetical protein n=1 Tax=Bifidobacterium sp. ESL0790 TaxID=2983233 RepID=UPI0023F68DDF|nr:hypothetical protein [Bifidobacterium sp. ESL0790]WEV72590.1 hypothetical protein OZY47_00965 [Bifidobacterium sp. ESL0790]